MPCTLSQNDCSGAACVFCLPGLPSLCLPSLPLRSCGHGVPLPPGPSSLRMALRISLRDVVKPCTLSQNDCPGAACLCCLPGLPSLCLPSLPLRSCGLGPVAWTSVTGRQVSGPILLVLALVRGQPARCVWRRIVFRDVVKLQVRQKPGLVSASHLPLRWHMLLSFPSELDTRMRSFPSSLVHPFPSFPPWCVQKRLPLPLPDVKRSLLDHSAQPQEGQERIAEESSTYGRVNEEGGVRTASRVEGSR